MFDDDIIFYFDLGFPKIKINYNFSIKRRSFVSFIFEHDMLTSINDISNKYHFTSNECE